MIAFRSDIRTSAADDSRCCCVTAAGDVSLSDYATSSELLISSATVQSREQSASGEVVSRALALLTAVTHHVAACGYHD